MTLRLPFSAIPLGFPLRRNWNYWLDVEFANAQAAPLVSYNGEVGSLDFTDSLGTWSVVDGELVPSAAVTGAGDPRFLSNALYSVAGGRLLASRLKIVSSFGTSAFIVAVAFDKSNAASAGATALGGRGNGTANVWQAFDGTSIATTEPLTLDTYTLVSTVLRPSGGFFWFIDKKLVWIGVVTDFNPVYVKLTNTQAGRYPSAVDYVRVRDLSAPFTTDYGIAVINQASPVSGTDYTGTADGICDLTITAPNPLAGTTGFRFHHTSNNDCDFVYTDSTSGRLRLDTVVGGVATNRISVNSVFAVGTTVTVRAIYTGALKDLFSLSGTTWTKRGAQVNVSNQPTQTNVAATIGGSYTVANLREYDRSAASYSVLDGS